MALTKVSGDILKQPLNVGIITATSINVSGITTLGIATATNLTSQSLVVSGITTLGIATATNLTSQSLVVSGISTFTNGTILVGSGTSTGTVDQKLQVTGGAYVSGNVGIGTNNPTYKLHVNGSFAATTKSFVIPHPTKPNYKLQHGSLEGPENGVYIRGRTTENIIELPEYWTKLVDENSITVNLTPIGDNRVWIEEINNNKVYIDSNSDIDCFYTVFAERKDVEKLIVEIEEN